MRRGKRSSEQRPLFGSTTKVSRQLAVSINEQRDLVCITRGCFSSI